MSEGSIAPERVAPGRPDTGVRPIVVSSDLPALMAHMDAPEPRCITMRFVSEGS